MGKIKTELMKRIAEELIEKYPQSFSVEFEQNKQFLKGVNLDVSKRLRNRIAGYITSLTKIKQAPTVEEAPQPAVEEAM